MQEFVIYLTLGFEHLLDVQAPDHLLFILMLALPYNLKDWKKLFGLATAFTLGHSLTLAMAIFTNPHSTFTDWVEFLIAFSIALTALFNFFAFQVSKSLYGLIVFFGLIHGYGFSNMLKSLLSPTDFTIWNTLLPFNLGLEIAQLLWISLILVLNSHLHYPPKIRLGLYSLTFIISIFWMFNRFPL